MNAQHLIQELESCGVVIAVDHIGLVLYPAGKIRAELKPLVKLYEAELINMKSVQSPIEIAAEPCPTCHSRLVRGGECAGRCVNPECTPCLCEVYHIRLDSDCPGCHAPLCVFCSGCQRAARIWREAQRHVETYSEVVSIPMDSLLKRLRKGGAWVTGEYKKQMADAPDASSIELFSKALATWDELERVLRSKHGYQNCIYGEAQQCPSDGPVRCNVCAYTEDSL